MPTKILGHDESLRDTQVFFDEFLILLSIHRYIEPLFLNELECLYLVFTTSQTVDKIFYEPKILYRFMDEQY